MTYPFLMRDHTYLLAQAVHYIMNFTPELRTLLALKYREGKMMVEGKGRVLQTTTPQDAESLACETYVMDSTSLPLQIFAFN